MTELRWTWLGRAPYRPVWEQQEAIRDAIIAGTGPERLLLVEHEPVITLGRRARPAHVLVPAAEVVRTTRGGEVTVHGPGQLVIYPVVRLTRGVLAHMEAVAGAIVDELAAHGVTAAWRRDPAGVYTADGAKIAACGLHVKRRVAVHGFALNVGAESTAPFAWIVPCGATCARVTSMAEHGAALALPTLAESLAVRIARALSRTPMEFHADRAFVTCDR